MAGCTPSASAPATDSGYKSTINAAIACMSAGDTIEIRSGTYPEFLGQHGPAGYPPSGSSWSSPTAIKAYRDESVRIRPSGNHSVLTIFDSSNQYLVFDTLIFDGANLTRDGLFVPQIITVGNGSHIRLIRSEIVNMPGGYGSIWSDGTDYQILYNIFHESYPDPAGYHDGGRKCGQSSCWGYPIYFGGSGSRIEGNTFYNFPSWGIHMYGDDKSRISNNNVKGNIFFNFGNTYWPTPASGAAGPGDNRGTAILLSSGSNNLAMNNQISHGPKGIHLRHFNNNKAFNNTISFMTEVGIDTEGSTGAIARSNLLYQNATHINPTFGTGATFGSNVCDVAGPGCR
jgi:parallel beta-helix repeat protein